MPLVRATRYITPLREGGSLPGLMEADDLGIYVVKYRGAGQGPKALVAEVICAGLAGALGLAVPRWVPIDVAAALAPAEPDEEVQHLLRESAGLNLGVDFLPGALDVGARPAVSAELAGRIVWFDALIGNADRSWRNPNMLLWHRQLYLIDHGAALVFHHSWAPDHDNQVQRFARSSYDVADHALVECRPDVAAADRRADEVDLPGAVRSAVEAVPDEWLDDRMGGPSGARAAYERFLLARIAERAAWVPDLTASVARGAARDAVGRRVSQRASAGPPDWISELRIGRALDSRGAQGGAST
jgi:HipA-like kinase